MIIAERGFHLQQANTRQRDEAIRQLQRPPAVTDEDVCERHDREHGKDPQHSGYQAYRGPQFCRQELHQHDELSHHEALETEKRGLITYQTSVAFDVALLCCFVIFHFFFAFLLEWIKLMKSTFWMQETNTRHASSIGSDKSTKSANITLA